MIPLEKLSSLLPNTSWALPPPYENATFATAYTSDLLSDVMAHAPPDSVLITLQAHRNTIAVASLVGIRAILLCHNRKPPEEMLDAARQEKIAILVTPICQYEASWRLHEALEQASTS